MGDLEFLKNYDIFADFGNGDKFHLSVESIDNENKKIILKGSQGQMRWIKIDALYPIKISNNI